MKLQPLYLASATVLFGLGSGLGFGQARAGSHSEGFRRHRVEFAYVANQSANDVSGYQIGPNGKLTPISGSPFTAGSAPNGVAIHPSGKFAYVANIISDNVSAYRIGKNGALTPVPGSPFSAASGPASVTIDPTGKFLYAANCGANCSGSGDGNISAYITTRLALSPVSRDRHSQRGNIPTFWQSIHPANSLILPTPVREMFRRTK